VLSAHPGRTLTDWHPAPGLDRVARGAPGNFHATQPMSRYSPMTRLTCRCRVGLGPAITDQGRRSSRLRTSPAAARSPGAGLGRRRGCRGASPSSSINRSISTGLPSRSSSARTRCSRMPSRVGEAPAAHSDHDRQCLDAGLRSVSTPPAARVSPPPGRAGPPRRAA
jgi:hypothetical protein